MGLTEEPGLLDGYGPLAADAARELAMHGPGAACCWARIAAPRR